MKIKTLLWILAFTLVPAVTRSQTVPRILPAASRLSALKSDRTDAVRYVGGAAVARSDEDIGAQINSAYASLPPTGGAIVVVGDPGGECYSFTTPIVANVPGKYLLLEGGSVRSQVVHSMSAAACLDYTPTAGAAITLDYVPSGGGSNPAVTYGIPNLTLTNNHCEALGGCGSGAVGIAFGGANGGAEGATFAGVRVIGFGTALTVLGSRSSGGNLSFRDCTLSYNTMGFVDVQSGAEHISFDGCRFQGNGTAVSSSVSLTISNSTLDSNTTLGVNCSSPAPCELNHDHFENGNADSTHFLAGNGVVSVLGGDMRDSSTRGTTDWWMNFAGGSFLILGTSLSSGGRTTTHVILNDAAGDAVVQTNSSDLTRNLYSNPQLVSSLVKATDGSPNLAAEPSIADPTKPPSTTKVASTSGQNTPSLYNMSGIKIVDGTQYPANGAGVNQALTDLSSSGTQGGEVWLTINITANDNQISIPSGETLRVLSSLTTGFPILLGKYSHLTCTTNGGPSGNGNIIASRSMPQMVRAAVQDGSLETFYVDHCALSGNGYTFSGAGVVDLGGVNDAGYVDDLIIGNYSGAAAIGAVDSNGFDPGPSHVNIDRIWANPHSSAPCLSFIHGPSTSTAYIQQIRIGYFECQTSSAVNAVILQNNASSGYALLRDISIDFLAVDGETGVTNNVLLDGVKRVLLKFVRCSGTKPCVHITNNPSNQDIDLGMTEVTGPQINVLDDANGITRRDPVLYNYHFLNPNALTEAASVHLDNQVFTRISLAGSVNGAGMQLFSTPTNCTTAARFGSTCTTAPITLPVGYSDTNYRLVCSGLSPTNVPAIIGPTKSNTTFTLTIVAITAAPASYDSFDCIAEHN